MEQFSVEKYLENSNRKVVTRDGRSARIICTNRMNSEYPVVVLMRNGNNEVLECYTKDGKFIPNWDYNQDLFFAPEKKSGWINLYRYNSITTLGTQVYDTKEEAESAVGDKSYYITTIKIEWEE